MSHTIVHRVGFVLIACIAFLAFPVASLAAPPTFHGSYEFTEDVTICGVDGTLHITGIEVVWEEGDSVRVAGQGKNTFVADDGRTVIFHHGGTFTGSYTDNGDGTATIVENFTGLAGSTRGSQGGSVLRDVGVIVFTTVIDIATEDVLSTEITLAHGPHPEAESGFTNFCDFFPEALG